MVSRLCTLQVACLQIKSMLQAGATVCGHSNVCYGPGADSAVNCTGKANATLKEGFYGAQGSQPTMSRLRFNSLLLHGILQVLAKMSQPVWP